MNAPDNIIIADRAEPVEIGSAIILPAPLQRRRDVVDLTDWFDSAATLDGHFRIGLAHGSIAEFLPEPGEALNPIAINRAETARLDYLALGDWHGQLKVDPRTWYSGTPETDRFKDNDSGFVLKVSLQKPGCAPQVEAVRTSAITWRRAQIEITPGDADRFAERLSGLTAESEAVVRLVLTGVVDLATRAEVMHVVEEAAARVLDLDLDDTGLLIEPSDDDLDAIDTAGFVRTALDDLRGRLDGPEGDTARRALAHLHRLHLEAEG